MSVLEIVKVVEGKSIRRFAHLFLQLVQFQLALVFALGQALLVTAVQAEQVGRLEESLFVRVLGFLVDIVLDDQGREAPDLVFLMAAVLTALAWPADSRPLSKQSAAKLQ